MSTLRVAKQTTVHFMKVLTLRTSPHGIGDHRLNIEERGSRQKADTEQL